MILALFTCSTFWIINLKAQNISQIKYNLNFEEYKSKEGSLPSGWFKWGSEMVVGELIVPNNYVGKVISKEKTKFGCITYKIPANHIGDSITLSGYIKYSKVKGYVGLLLRIDGYNSKASLGFENMKKNKISGTSDWKRYSIKLPLSVNAKNIYIGGILVGIGTAWFDDFKVEIDGKDIQTINNIQKRSLKDYNIEKLNSAIQKSSIPISLSIKDSLISKLTPLINKLGEKKIVAIGESTHGTSEFYKLREIITKQLIKKHGFNLVILENAYDEIELLNEKLQIKSLDDLIGKHLFAIYQTEEMKSFLSWSKEYFRKKEIKFKGCDDSIWSFYELLTM